MESENYEEFTFQDYLRKINHYLDKGVRELNEKPLMVNNLTKSELKAVEVMKKFMGEYESAGAEALGEFREQLSNAQPETKQIYHDAGRFNLLIGNTENPLLSSILFEQFKKIKSTSSQVLSQSNPEPQEVEELNFRLLHNSFAIAKMAISDESGRTIKRLLHSVEKEGGEMTAITLPAVRILTHEKPQLVIKPLVKIHFRASLSQNKHLREGCELIFQEVEAEQPNVLKFYKESKSFPGFDYKILDKKYGNKKL